MNRLNRLTWANRCLLLGHWHLGFILEKKRRIILDKQGVFGIISFIYMAIVYLIWQFVLADVLHLVSKHKIDTLIKPRSAIAWKPF